MADFQLREASRVKMLTISRWLERRLHFHCSQGTYDVPVSTASDSAARTPTRFWTMLGAILSNER